MGIFKALWRVLVRFYHRCSSPPHFYAIAGKMLPWCVGLTLTLFAVGIIWGLGFAPSVSKQGEVYRIIYIHVPAATLSMLAYVFVTIAAAIGMVWRMKMAQIVAVSAIPIGTGLTLVALLTGMIWGHPTWGTYWEWNDPRMLLVFIMFLLFIGLVVINNAIEDKTTAANAIAILSISGLVTVPLIKMSTSDEFQKIVGKTIHQGQTEMFNKNQMTPEIAYIWLIMIFAFLLFFVTVLLMRIRNEILEREQNTKWVKEKIMS